jgi:hypothetical protein
VIIVLQYLWQITGRFSIVYRHYFVWQLFMLEQSNIAEGIKIFLLFKNAQLLSQLWQNFVIRSVTIFLTAYPRSGLNIIIQNVLTYTKVVSFEYFDKKYEWISHFSETSYIPRIIHPSWLSHGVDILKKLQIVKPDIIQLSPVFRFYVI